MSEQQAAHPFLDALHNLFIQAPAGMSSPTWVAGLVVGETDVVCLYRQLPDAPIHGRRIAVAKFSELFDPPQTSRELASIFYNSEIADPSGPGEQLDVDWADATGVKRSDIRWIAAQEPQPNASRQ